MHASVPARRRRHLSDHRRRDGQDLRRHLRHPRHDHRLIKVATATAAGLSFGVAAYDAASGARVPVIRGKGSIVPVTAGGTIAFGAEVEVGTGGKAVTIASGKARGRAVEAGTNGNDVMIELY
jgi:hypothetical protein